ncbi:hypothetical protein F320042A7_22720 [Blautia producta]
MQLHLQGSIPFKTAGPASYVSPEYLFQLGLLKDDFSIKNRLYMYHFLEQGDVFQTFFSKYKGISDTRPVVERGAVMLSEVGKTAILIDVE